MINNHKNKRFADLAVLGEVVFHSSDLAILWGIKSKNTLHQTLSRYVAAGLLKRIYKGFYALTDPADIDPYLLGIKSLHTYAYVSCESVLSKHGAINQSPQEITIVSNVSRRWKIAAKRFRSRKLADQYLYNNAGIELINGVPTASLERAIADMLYFNPHAYFDAHGSTLINWVKVKDVARKIGYNIRIPS
jgi:predicted transcriptional regulator of viral defense system